ncbi:MAG TPA: hypothetical protein ENK26_10070 [Gammaproteobacteria bacterium]|nr:hypothetical protein [Gammaproteobacteria bacterium]
MSKFRLIFIHLPKTAGTTVREILRSRYGSDAVCGIYDGDPGFISQEAFAALPPSERDQYQIYCGHFAYGIHDKITPATQYYAMFRDPVERVVSYYHHAMRHAPVFQGSPVSLMKFLDRQDWQIDNLYTRMISGQKAPVGKCSEAMLAQAVDNIEKHFVCVGLQDEFHASIDLLCASLGWKALPDYAPLNIGVGKPSLDYFSSRELDRIRELNTFDLALYEKVRAVFKASRERISSADCRVDTEVA